MANPEPEDRGLLLVEYLAAASIFCIVAVVLYMVFAYKPY
jgi:hypothetical protein